MITQFRVQNYKALRDVTLDLTPIHVLIGPNDSGKTSILEAIAALCRSVDHPLADAFQGSWKGRELVWRNSIDALVDIGVTMCGPKIKSDYGLSIDFDKYHRNGTVAQEWMECDGQRIILSPRRDRSSIFAFNHQRKADPILDSDVKTSYANSIFDALSGVHFYHFDASMLALPVAQSANRGFKMDHSGFGLSLVLDNVLGDDRRRFDELETHFRRIFPEVELVKLVPETAYTSPVDNLERVPMLNRAHGKGLYFRMSGADQEVPASQVSDGVLLVLAYLAILYSPKPPRVLLIEEPENGIHPQRLQEILSILREIVREQSYTQVILTTHSPYAVDEFKPEEVTVCIKQDDGSVAVKRLSDSDAVRKQIDIFTLGEIWTAEGDEALVKPETVSEENAG